LSTIFTQNKQYLANVKQKQYMYDVVRLLTEKSCLKDCGVAHNKQKKHVDDRKHTAVAL